MTQLRHPDQVLTNIVSTLWALSTGARGANYLVGMIVLRLECGETKEKVTRKLLKLQYIDDNGVKSKFIYKNSSILNSNK